MLQAMEGKSRNTGDENLCITLTVNSLYNSVQLAVDSCSSDMFNKLKYCVVKIVFEVVD